MFMKYLQHIKWEIFIYKFKENEPLREENFLPKNFYVRKFNIILVGALVDFLRNLTYYVGKLCIQEFLIQVRHSVKGSCSYMQA
jgi:hypothetical protein